MKKTAVVVMVLIGCNSTAAPLFEPAPINTTTTGDAATLDSSVDSGSSPESGIIPIDIFDGSTPPNLNNKGETDNGCGGPNAPKCGEGRACLIDRDCVGACNYNHVCMESPSCKIHYGGNTCGVGEVGQVRAQHESCCKSLEVVGFSDSSHPGKRVFVDRYEITVGRMKEFIAALTKQSGKPDIKSWVSANANDAWNSDWDKYLPIGWDEGSVVVPALETGDPRHSGQTQEQAGPGVVLPSPVDLIVSTGVNSQFSGKVYLDLHGANCGTYADSYGFPTYYYDPLVSIANGEIPRQPAKDSFGNSIPPEEWLSVKSLNCVTSVMLEAFCMWDTQGQGGLMTTAMFDYITGSPTDLPDTVARCGTQRMDHGALLGNDLTSSIFDTGRCAVSYGVNKGANITFDAGDVLPLPGNELNRHIYFYPDLQSTSDKSYQVAAPGRIQTDAVRLFSGGEAWYDLTGNLAEQTRKTGTSQFAIRGFSVGIGSEYSDLNATIMPSESVIRTARAQSKSGLSGGRCFRLK